MCYSGGGLLISTFENQGDRIQFVLAASVPVFVPYYEYLYLYIEKYHFVHLRTKVELFECGQMSRNI